MRLADFLVAALSLALAVTPAMADARTDDAAVAEARQAARADRHDDAIEAFRRAIAAAPERRADWLLELADQLTWAGRFNEAIALYREASATDNREEERRARVGLARALAWSGDQNGAIAEYDHVLARMPSDREARLGRAQALSWSNRQSAALLAYRAVLRDHPEDSEALRGQARVQSWRGRYRVAIALMEEYLRNRPRDREAVRILAESLDWMGTPDRAESVLREHLGADPGDARAASLLGEIEGRQRPEAGIDWRDFDQSDNLEIRELSLTSRVPFADGRGAFGARYAIGRYEPAQGPVRAIEVQRPGIAVQYRLSDAFDWRGDFALALIDTDGAEGDHERAIYDTTLTYHHNDVFRVDLGASRWVFDSEAALRAGLTASQVSAALIATPSERTRVAARASWADYADGNERLWWQGQIEYRVLHAPRVWLGYRYTGFDFERPGQNGYYNPDRYQSHEGILHAYGRFRERFRWDFRSAAGYEVERPGQSRFIGNAGASVTWELQRRLELEVAYDYSSSRAASSTGFERGIARITLRNRF